MQLSFPTKDNSFSEISNYELISRRHSIRRFGLEYNSKENQINHIDLIKVIIYKGFSSKDYYLLKNIARDLLEMWDYTVCVVTVCVVLSGSSFS